MVVAFEKSLNYFQNTCCVTPLHHFDSMRNFTLAKDSIALRLLKVVFSIYLIITLGITLIQMTNEYLSEEHFVRDSLTASQEIFQENITAAIWNLDDGQLQVTVQGILKQPTLVGAKVMDETGNSLIKQGKILNEKLQPVLLENNKELPLSYISLFQHVFNLTREGKAIGTVTLYSSNHIVFNRVKYNFLVIILNAVIKTMALWLLFIWAFNKFLTRQLDVFCQTMENIDIDDQKSCTLNLETFNTRELSRIEHVFNDLLRRIIENRDRLDELNKTLEQKVIERTQQLQSAIEIAEQANREMAVAHKKINDSIEYASLIQKAILPHQQLTDFLGDNQSVVWQPRDIVGGDFYIFHARENGYLLGVIDCAGHGVPGSLMTMLARAALDQAISECEIDSPARLLTKMDGILRKRLENAKMSRGLAVSIDAGLVFVDSKQQQIGFAGAKMSLYWTDGQQVVEVKGGNRAIFGSRVGHYENTQLTIQPDMTFCLTSDGVLDQAGGSEGFSFGNARFTTLFCQHAMQPVSEQAKIIMHSVNQYRGDCAQRDDITLLFFKPQ